MSVSDSPLVTQRSFLLPNDGKNSQLVISGDEYFDISLASEPLQSDMGSSSRWSKQSTNIQNPLINTNIPNQTPPSVDSIDYIEIPTIPPSPIEHYMLFIPQNFYNYIWDLIARFRFTWSYVISQIKRTPRSFIIGCSTILIVVAFISLLYNTIDKAGLVFLKLAEIKVGENDLLIQNSMNIEIKSANHNATNITLPMIMNYTSVYQNIYDNNDSNLKYNVKGLAARWIVPTLVKLKYDSNKNASILTQIINSTQEKSMDLSRSWKYDKLLNNECYLTQSVMRHLGFQNNDEIIGQLLQFNIGDILTMISEMMNQTVDIDEKTKDNSENNNEDQPVDNNNGNTNDKLQSQNAINMAKLIYFIAYANGVDLYPSFGNTPNMTSYDDNNNGIINMNCYLNDGMEYYGTHSFTKSGLECQSWFVDTPHNISYSNSSTNLLYNFCRNPNKGMYISTKPWCYTISSQLNQEKETCNIPNCLQNYTECEFTSYKYNATNISKLMYKQTCNKGIILSIQYAFFGLFNATQCPNNFNGDDIFILNTYWNESINCYANMTQYLYAECIGKYECEIDLLKYINVTQYFENCPLYNHENNTFNLKFIVELECNFPYEWDQNIYMNDSIINTTLSIFEHIPFFLLPIEVNNNKEDISHGLHKISGKALTIDELRWIILIATLSNFNFDLEFVVKDIINKPDGKWSEELGSIMLIESEFVEHYIHNILGNQLDQIAMYLEIINYIMQNYTDFDSNNEQYDEKNIVSLFIKATVAIENQRKSNPDDYTKISESLSKFKINNFAQITIINAKDRLNIYQKNYNQIKREICNFGNKLTSTLYTMKGTTNYLSAHVQAPLLKIMKVLGFLKILLNSILTSMTVIIGILSCVIIYCLMIIDVENKTFECGVLRSIGMMKSSVIYILNMKSLLFCIPGIIIGLIISTLANIPITNIISNYVNIDPKYILSFNCMFIASLLFGLIIPIISGLIPMRKALSTTLSNSLNLYFNTIDAVFVRMINRNEYGINFMTLIISLMLILISFVCLYVIPYCVVNENFPLFFTIFDLIFLGLLFGLGIIALTIQNKLDLFICKLLMNWGPQKKIRYLVYKNIHSHKIRNNKTGIMLIISCAFIVFSGCMVELQSDNFESLFTVLAGADLVFQSIRRWYSLPEYDIKYRFKNYNNYNKLIEDYTFVTWSIEEFKYASKFTFGPLGRQYSTNIFNHLIGVEKNYCNVAYCDKYLVITDVSNSVKMDKYFPRLLYDKNIYDPIAGLYYNDNKTIDDVTFPPIDIISGHVSDDSDIKIRRNEQILHDVYLKRIHLLVSTAMKDSCGMDVHIPLKINVRFYRWGSIWYYKRYGISKIIASKVPGFWFSAHSQVASLMTTLTTMNDYNYLLNLLYRQFGITQPDPNNKTHGFPYNLQKQKLLIRMKNNTNQQDRTEIIDLISSILNNDYILITDTKKTIIGIKKTTNLLSIFFKLVSILTMLLCFFISFISFKQNIDDNIYQFGVLKSIGLNNLNIVSIFIFESIIITISSLFCGTIIGIGQAVAITLQSQILTENIFIFKFPINLYAILIISSFIIAILSSFIPSLILIKTPPALILRM